MAKIEKEYKYKVPGNVFLDAVKATNEEFEEQKAKFATHGLKRLSPAEVNKLHPGLIVSYFGEPTFTLIEDGVIQPNNDDYLDISNLKNIPPIVIVNCKLPDTHFKNLELINQLNYDNLNSFICKETVFNSLSISNSNILGLEFRSVNFGFFSLKNNVSLDYMQLIHCSSNATLFVTQNCTISTLHFEDFKINSVVMESSSVDSLDLEKTSIPNGIHCSDNSNLKTTRINNESSIGILQFRHSNCNEILINASNLTELSIKDSSSVNKLNFTESVVYKLSALDSEINIIDGFDNLKIKYLEFYNCIIKSAIFKDLECDIHFTKTTFSEMSISNSNLGLLNVGPNSNFNLYTIDTNISYLLLKKMSINQTSSISFSNVAIYTCIIEETDILGRAHFRNINSLPHSQFKSSDFGVDFSFGYGDHLNAYSEIEKNGSSLFRISYSSLGTTEFIDCDLSSFQSFQFNNSRFTDVFISGGSLPEKNISIIEAEKNGEVWYEQLVSLYNQFSSVFQAQGHIYKSINYRSKSSQYQMELLKKRKDWLNLIPFKLNAWSNQHGASWAKALWFLIWTSACFYLLVLISTGNIFKFDNAFKPAFIGYFFDFINPLRPFDFYSEIGLIINGWTRFFDLLSRVVIGYGIYQLIAAFRRYGRK